MLFVPLHMLFQLGDFGAPQRQRDAIAGVPDIAELEFCPAHDLKCLKFFT
jgi:hypothetical protein